jgi:hypothetical protein
MVTLVTEPTLVDGIRELVPVVSGTRTLGAALAMDFSMADGPPASHSINYAHSWLQDSDAGQQKLLNKIVDFFASDFGGAHTVIRLIITCAVRLYSFMLHTLPLDVCRPYLATANSDVRTVVFRNFGVSYHGTNTLSN